MNCEIKGEKTDRTNRMIKKKMVQKQGHRKKRNRTNLKNNKGPKATDIRAEMLIANGVKLHEQIRELIKTVWDDD